MFGNGVLRRIFGCKREEVTGEWRKLHNGPKELQDLFHRRKSGQGVKVTGHPQLVLPACLLYSFMAWGVSIGKLRL
jgi:hypothetical protein